MKIDIVRKYKNVSRRTKLLSGGGILLVAIIAAGFFVFHSRQLAGITESVKAGERKTVSFKQATVIVSADSLKQDAVIHIRIVASPPLPSPDVKYIGQTYEITSTQAAFEQPVVIVLQYDPAALPDPTKEDQLYLATWQNNQWVPVDGGIINKAAHTVTAGINHFSEFTILYSPTELLFKNVVETMAYDDLPNQIREDLIDSGYAKANIKALVRAEVAQATKLSTFVIAAANAINEVSGLAIAAAQNIEELAKEIVKTVAKKLVERFGGKAGEIIVKLYDYSEGTSDFVDAEIKTYKFGAGDMEAAEVHVALAKVAAFMLSLEMDYINDNMDGGLKDLWKLNPLDPNPLELYIVMVDVPSDKNGLNQRGIKYYYYDSQTDSYVNYYNNLAGAKLELGGETLAPAEYTFSATPPFEYPESLNVDKHIVDTDLNHRGGYSQEIRICSGSHCPKRQLIYDTDVAGWYKTEAEKAGWQTLVNNRGKDRIREIFIKGDLEFAVITNWVKNSKDNTKDELVVNIYWGPKYPITTAADYEKLPNNCGRQIMMNLNLGENFTRHPIFNFPLYEGRDSTGKIKILATEELERNKTYRLKGCKTNKVFTKSVGETVFFVRPEWPEAAFKSIEDVIHPPPEPERAAPVSELTTSAAQPGSFSLLATMDGSRSSGDYSFKFKPRDLTFDQQGKIYILDSDFHQVHIFDKNGKHLSSFNFYRPQEEATIKEMVSGTNIYVDSQHRIFVADGVFCRFQVFNEQGNYLFTIGRAYDKSLSCDTIQGEGAQISIQSPRAVVVDSTGNIHTFQYRGKIRIFSDASLVSDATSYDGYIHHYPAVLKKTLDFFGIGSEVFIDSQDRIYATNAGLKKTTLEVYNTDYKLIDTLKREDRADKNFILPSMTLGLDGRIYVIDKKEDKWDSTWILIVYDQSLKVLGYYDIPKNLNILRFAVDTEGRVYIADYNNSRVQIYNLLPALSPVVPSSPSTGENKEEPADSLVYPGAVAIGGGMTINDPDGQFSCWGQVYAAKGVTRDQIIAWYLSNLPKLGWTKTGERGTNSPVFQKGNQSLWVINVFNIESLSVPNKRKLTSDEVPFMLCR